MRNILLALFLVLPFTLASSAELTGKHIPAPKVLGAEPFMLVQCNGCPEKSRQEKFVDDLTIEDVGIVVVWADNDTPKRIIITSTSTAPVSDVCDTFKKHYPNLVTTIVTHIGRITQHRCAQGS